MLINDLFVPEYFENLVLEAAANHASATILIMNRRRDTGTHWYEVGRAGFAWVMHRGADGGYPVVPGQW